MGADRYAVATAAKATVMIDEGRLDGLCAGHKPMSPVVVDHSGRPTFRLPTLLPPTQ